jgi:hypothetical protein
MVKVKRRFNDPVESYGYIDYAKISQKLREELVNAYSFDKYRDLAGRTIIEVNSLTQHWGRLYAFLGNIGAVYRSRDGFEWEEIYLHPYYPTTVEGIGVSRAYGWSRFIGGDGKLYMGSIFHYAGKGYAGILRISKDDSVEWLDLGKAYPVCEIMDAIYHQGYYWYATMNYTTGQLNLLRGTDPNNPTLYHTDTPHFCHGMAPYQRGARHLWIPLSNADNGRATNTGKLKQWDWGSDAIYDRMSVDEGMVSAAGRDEAYGGAQPPRRALVIGSAGYNGGRLWLLPGDSVTAYPIAMLPDLPMRLTPPFPYMGQPYGQVTLGAAYNSLVLICVGERLGHQYYGGSGGLWIMNLGNLSLRRVLQCGTVSDATIFEGYLYYATTWSGDFWIGRLKLSELTFALNQPTPPSAYVDYDGSVDTAGIYRYFLINDYDKKTWYIINTQDVSITVTVYSSMDFSNWTQVGTTITIAAGSSDTIVLNDKAVWARLYIVASGTPTTGSVKVQFTGG